MLTNKLYNIAFLFLWCIAAPSIDVVAADNILCPGQPTENFCDCEGDCTGNPEYCACSEGKACCVDATPVVLCPDQPKQNYCDCTGDCTEQPEWCQCADAQKCCKDFELHKQRSVFVAMSGASFASFLALFLYFRSKKAKGQESSVSKATVDVKSSLSKQNDDFTVA